MSRNYKLLIQVGYNFINFAVVEHLVFIFDIENPREGIRAGARVNNAIDAFRENVTFNGGKAQIQLETGVEFWVNSSTTDFTQYIIRPRIK